MPDETEKSMEDVIRADGRYAPEAFAFLHEGLAAAVKDIYGEDAQVQDRQHHVTGKQLCQSLRDLAVSRWGMLARTVLRKWNINATVDFGNMVYLLVQNGFMNKTDEDNLEDFRDVFDLDEAMKADEDFDLKE